MSMRKPVPMLRLVSLALIVLLAPASAWSQATPAATPSQPQSPPPPPPAKSSVYEQLNLFGEAFERIRQDAVEPVSDEKLIETAIAGMLSGLDPNCVYLTEDEYKAKQAPVDQTTGSTGLVVTIDAGQLKVVSPRDGSPAADAGIKPGETILAIDKAPVFDLTLPQIDAQLRGPVDSEVTLTFRGDDSKPHDMKVKRVATKWSTVSSRLEDDDIGYIRVAGFDDATQAALTAAVQNLQQQAGNKLIGFVVDLRNNPGGNFDVAVQAADDFIDKGDIAVVKGRKGDVTKRIAATPGDLTNGLPLVALVNGGTASEAELVAGALQDDHRAVLVGTKTFGESAIETLIPLNGNGAIELTTARFETPGGHAIQGKGLDPDVTVAPVKLERIAQGFGRREADLPGALKNTDPVSTNPAPANGPPQAPGTNPANPAAKPGAPSAPPAPGAAPSPEAAAPAPEKHDTRSSVATGDLGGSQDEQLLQALDMLRGLKMVSARNGQ
ncbi:MAG TPA: S41 family peptidase [Stellaceae bacterium]|jgi:carboxyl-terminal processing protease|nr:S41 family peptidase [Stellaceae bacterium]